jgi:MYXO-CTERM domain-containing protein
LISPRVVLTARHCIADSPKAVACTVKNPPFGPVRAPSMYQVTTRPDYTADLDAFKLSGTWYKVAKIRAIEEGSDLCGYDLALLVLEQDIPEAEAKPLGVALKERAQIGQKYSAVGFGLPEAGRRMRLDGLQVQCLDDCPPGQINAKREWGGDKGLMSGDSGGPALDLDGRVIGVASRSDGAVSCYEDLYVARDWLRGAMVEIAQETGVALPPWVLEDGAPMGSVCTQDDECSSAICVKDGVSSPYCSRPCGPSTSCPSAYRCDAEQDRCVKRDDFGDACGDRSDCNDGVCVQQGARSYCSRSCSAERACPPGSICNGAGVCEIVQEQYQRPPEGCAVDPAGARGSPEALAGLALLALLGARRRRPAQARAPSMARKRPGPIALSEPPSGPRGPCPGRQKMWLKLT